MLLLLVATAHGSPSLEQAARDALPSLPDGVSLDLVAVLPRGSRGAVVQLRPRIDGLVVDELTTVRFDPEGQVRGIVSDPLPTRRVTGDPVSADRAIAAARHTVGGSRPRARLSWQVTGEVLRRVWTIELDGTPPGPGAPRVRVDAVSGAVMTVDDAADIDAPLALVYREHPLAEPVPSPVPLPLATEALSDVRVEIHQCRDQGQLDRWEFANGDVLDMHVCTVVPADGPVDGDYLYEPVPYPDDPGRDEDDFAGPQVYWNVHRGLDWFDALGWVSSPDFDPRLMITVNRRNTDLWSTETASDPTLSLLPYDNAYSTGGYFDYYEEWIPPALVFGQGTTADFGYDAEVIHHELGHFVVASQHGPSWSRDTDYGPSVRANSLNEGFADYFSAALHDDPVIGEYVSEDGVRDLGGADICAVDLIGESHYDSLPFSQGMWEFRTSLPKQDRPTFDTIVIDSLAIIGFHPDFPDAAAVIEALVAERLGDDRQAALAEIWEARGIHDCPPLITVTGGDEPFAEYGVVPGSYWYSTLGEMPGTLQYRVEIPEGGARIVLGFDQAQYLGLDPFERNAVQPLVVVGRSGERLTWTQEEREATITLYGTQFTLDVTEWVSDGADVATTEALTVAPHETNPQYDMHHHEAAWDVETPGSYVFQLTNGYERTATLYDLAVQLVPLVPPPTTTVPDDEVIVDEYPDEVVEDPVKGCGCASTGSGSWILGLAVLGLARRRRG